MGCAIAIEKAAMHVQSVRKAGPERLEEKRPNNPIQETHVPIQYFFQSVIQDLEIEPLSGPDCKILLHGHIVKRYQITRQHHL
jgi:hypothetical protein